MLTASNFSATKWNRLSQIDPLLGQVRQTYQRLPIYPKTHYVMSRLTKEVAIDSIRAELEAWRPELEAQGKLIEASSGCTSAPCSISK